LTGRCALQATLELRQYAQRLLLLYSAVFLLLGGPIAAQTFEPFDQVWHRFVRVPSCGRARASPVAPPCWASHVASCLCRGQHGQAFAEDFALSGVLQPLEFFLSASVGSLLVVAVAALRVFLAWKYVGDRLLTASLEYEETGW
jgi:hypothetical protein